MNDDMIVWAILVGIVAGFLGLWAGSNLGIDWVENDLKLQGYELIQEPIRDEWNVVPLETPKDE